MAPDAEFPRGRSAPSLERLTDDFADLGQVMLAGTGSAVEAVVDVAVRRVPGTDFASITRATEAGFETVASTDGRAVAADRVQYQLGSGPCVDATVEDPLYRPRDLQHDPRWPEFGRRVHSLGVRSMLCYRLPLDSGPGRAALNLYATEVDAFGDAAVTTGLLVATHGAVAVNAEHHHSQVSHLERALESNRVIGTAIGIVMAELRIERQQAFDLLSIVSQHTNEKLARLAEGVVTAGTLELPDDLHGRLH